MPHRVSGNEDGGWDMNLHVSGMDVPCKPPPSPPPPSSPNPPPPPTPHRAYPHPALYQNSSAPHTCNTGLLAEAKARLGRLGLVVLVRAPHLVRCGDPAESGAHQRPCDRYRPHDAHAARLTGVLDAAERQRAERCGDRLGASERFVRGAQTLRDSIRCADDSW